MEDLITKFLNNKIIVDNRYSSLVIALEDARKITGRDIENGAIKHHILTSKNGHLEPYSFIGVLNYLIILDIIGNVFGRGKDDNKTNGIGGALYHFSDASQKDRNTIEALRNALAHSYSLVNVPPNPKYYDNSRHIFTLVAFEDAPLITYPSIQWDGNYNNKTDSRSTKIQTNKLFDLVEGVVQNVRTLEQQNELRIKLPIDEIKARYTVLK